MLVRYTAFEHNVCGEAPFVGARISGISCERNCPGCHNQHLLEEEVCELPDWNIIREVVENPFDEGIILGGLEWTEQPEEMEALVKRALFDGLQVMIYTSLDYSQFITRFPSLGGTNLLLKCGPYLEDFVSSSYQSMGISLPTTNQYVRTI